MGDSDNTEEHFHLVNKTTKYKQDLTLKPGNLIGNSLSDVWYTVYSSIISKIIWGGKGKQIWKRKKIFDPNDQTECVKLSARLWTKAVILL